MERSDDESDGDGLQSRLSPEASPHQSRLRRRRHLLQSLPRRRPSPLHQAPPPTSPNLGERGRRCHHRRRPRSLREAPGRGRSEIRRIARSTTHRRTRKHHKYHHHHHHLEVFELHMEELRAKQEEIEKRDEDIKLLEAIIRTLGGKESLSTSQ
ncbi:uncharacterized protein [Glycine max]|uniref:uncharacterized protein isoform X2 n=1 Tax=Glycine max TaxID=3847 RepID=UPI00023C59CE|nr:uncharacterized protein LOC100779456 isoform X2 [Glycine max]